MKLQKPIYMLTTIFIIVGFVLSIVIAVASYAPFKEFIKEYRAIKYPYYPTQEATKNGLITALIYLNKFLASCVG